jgi:O-antigen ligase
VVGLLQTTAHIDLHLLLQPPGFVDNQVDQGRGSGAILTDRFGATRAFGTSSHAIEFSVLAAVTVPLAIHFARYAANRQVRLLAALAAGVALLAMPAAISRSGVIALAAALSVYIWAVKLRGLGIAVVAGVVAVFVNLIAVPDADQALWKTITNSAQDPSVMDRVAAYAKASQTFHDHPVFGLGLGANPVREYGFLDNEWVQALVQGGSVGLVAMIVLASGGIFGIAAALRGATTPRERDQAYAMGAMFIGILASSYAFDLFSYQQAALLFFILFGLLWSNFTISFREAGITRAVADRASSYCAVERWKSRHTIGRSEI